MKKLISVEEAVAKVKDGMTVMIGGFLSNGTPNAIVNALAQSEVKNLILIVNDTAYPDKGCGQLIANKQVKKVIVSHIGFLRFCPARWRAACWRRPERSADPQNTRYCRTARE